MWSSSSSSPPSKKSKTETDIMMNNNRMNQGGSMQPPPPPPPNNKFKFNAKPANMAPPQQPYRGGASNPSNTNQNRGQISGQRGHAADKKEAQEDEDLLDISDTELIRASQVVESQLKFINNAHTTTNNAMNIFSQFSQTTTTQQHQQLHYHHHNQHHEGGGNQYAGNSRQQSNQPMPSTYSANHGAIMSTNPNYYADLTDEDIRSEILRLRNENLQKEGEVKILRDKLKKVEQDSQRMRTERLEFMKRISQQQEETSKAMQKQIEFKELENQFKSQEIVELTMKYKVLESSFKRNNNSQQPQQQITQQQQILQRPKSSTATKRHLDSMVTDGSASDTENDNPSFEVKRPMLAMNVSTSSSAMAAKPAVVAPPINRVPLSTSNITNNNQSCVYNKSLMNSSGSVSKFAQTKIDSTTSTMCAKIGPIKQASVTMIDESMMSFRPVPPQPRQRSCVLSSKLTRPGIISTSLSSPNELVYIITDQLAETTNYLNKFLNSDDTLLGKTRSNTIGVSKKLSELNELMDRTSSFESSSSSSGQILLKSLSNQVDRIEFVSNRLNEELKKLLDLALRTISTGGGILNDESSSESSGDEETSSSTASSSGLLKAFIDLLCVAFELSFNLFLFRVNYLYASSSVQQIDQLKNEFFTLTYHILDSIDYYPFTNATNNVKIMMGQNSMSRTASSSSAPNSSHSSYSTLKILTTTLHCFNRLLYLPCLSETMHSTSAPLLISLADNVHAISKPPLNLLDAKDTAPTSDAENEQHDNDFSCLYHFFYYKIITFFSEVVFSLDSNDSSHNKNNETNSGSSQQQMQIITTIGEESGDGLKIKNFKLDKPNNTTTTETRASTPTTPFIDTNMDLTSQLDSANNKTLTSTNQSSSQPTATTTSSTTNSTVNVDLINMNEINALKIELLVKFAYYVHNVQLFEALVTSRSKRKNTVAYTCRCACSNDMIYCYLVLVDYVFNEKMVFNASRSMLDEYLRRLSRPKSNYLFETRANKVVSTLVLRDESATSQKLGRACAIYEEKSQYSKMEESLLKLKLTEDEGVISFMNILIVNSFNTLIALLNTPNKCENSECQSAHEIEMRRQRVDYLESIRSDYRLINLSCLYKLAELNLDNSILPTTHFATSLNSLRALLKGFIDDSIDEDSSI